MSDILRIILTLIYLSVGIICLAMAFKCIMAKKFLSFHEAAAGKNWETIEKPLRNVMLTLLKISGLGFLMVALILIIFTVGIFSDQDKYISVSVPLLALIFSSGLFFFNLQLHRQTMAETPWRNSLTISVILIIALILSVIQF